MKSNEITRGHIIHRKDPAGITAPDVYKVDKNTNVLDWLNQTFKTQDELCGDLACSFWLNEKEIFRNDHDNADDSILDFTLGENDALVIINRPAAVLSVVTVVIAVISAAVAVIAYLNMPKLPGAEEGRNESPNNRLNAASNQFRPTEGIPECFGFGVSYPDFIQPSYYFYEGNVKKQVGLFCITAGSVEVDAVRIGDTSITNIPDSTANIYGPNVNPPSAFLTIHEASTNVDGQILLAPDDDSILTIEIDFTIAQVGSQSVVTIPAGYILDLGLADDEYLYIRSTYEIEDPGDPGEFLTIDAVNGVFAIDSIGYSGSDALIYFTNTYSGNLNVTGRVGRGWPEGAIGAGFGGQTDNVIGWFNTPGESASEIWIHWQAPLGVRRSGGGAITIVNRFIIQSVNTGATFAQDVPITENTLDPQFVTTRFTQSQFPGMVPGEYRVRAQRITGAIDANGNASEQIKLEGFISVTPYSNPNFGDTTKILVQRRATLFSPDQAGQKINVDYRRDLPYYNRVTGTYDLNDLRPTNSFADAAAYTLIVAGGETTESVNLAELYEIYDSLSSSRLGGFTFTFDDADLSKGERVEAICNAARVVSFHDGKQWRFSRDEAKPVRAALFNRRSVTGNGAQQAWQPQRDDDADSVRIIYVDPDDNTEVYEDRYFNPNTNSIVSGQLGPIPIEIKLAGCRDVFQAANRADLEIRRLAYQRRSVSETAYRDALELELLDRVGWVDINDVETFDGEILAINGDNFDTSERFIPESGSSYVVFLTDEEGYPSNTVPCSARLDTEFGFTATGLLGAYVATGNQQIGSRYFIADADDLAASNFTLKSRTPNADGTVEIELIEYRPEVFELDNALPPSGAPILNDGLTALDVGQLGDTASSSLTLESNGEISLNSDTALWYSEGATPSIGDSFEVYATVVSGSLDSGIVDQWITVSGASWSVDRSGTAGVDSCVLQLQIRQTDFPSNSVTNTVEIKSVIASPVSLPASITVSVDALVNYGSASFNVQTNGEWFTEDSSGNYTTIADGVGAEYEVKVTNLVGDIEGSAVDSWIDLDLSGATWLLGATVTSTTTFDVEIREKADVLNTASSSVSLTVNVPV